ncbi:HlyD family efflux transporter periplasmic adaptor subunit [Sphingobacterium kitahiroshimense]|uniref:HlyD family secretion protein n=1 Tax=Sphingobacterium sp. B16(2022) TaxID=2914044 RepID=UPI0014391DDE|nr:HlyD family secretion protein [Sphingobacterium sp. B16(2022)]NJI73229.1 HlyD family efflux transporter periplasmic adaptor subunit [Sphingobacterium sp. B16(2022)]
MEQSHKIRNILYKQPKKVVKWGNFIILIIVFLLLFFSYFMQDPDIVNGTGFLKKITNIEEVRSRTDGDIAKILYKENDIIKPNATIAIIRSNADYSSVLHLLQNLDSTLHFFKQKNHSVDQFVLGRSYGELAELQTGYADFLHQYSLFKNSSKNGIKDYKKGMKSRQYQLMTEEQQKIKKQLLNLDEKINLEQENYNSYKILFEKKIISLAEFRNKTQEFIDLKNQKINIEMNLVNNSYQATDDMLRIIEMDTEAKDELNSFFYTTMSFYNQVKIWIDSHSIISSRGGKLIFNKDIKEGTLVKKGESIFYVDQSYKSDDFMVELNLGTSAIGKVKEGQSVKLSIPAYPYQEFGYLRAEIKYLPEIGMTDTVYRATAILTDKNISSFNKPFHLKHGLFAEAKIITQRRSLLEKLLGNFRINDRF